MIFLTWIERRGWLRNYGQPVAALWCAEFTEADYQNARRYAAASGDDYMVHTFPDYLDYDTAKRYALDNAEREAARGAWILWPAC